MTGETLISIILGSVLIFLFFTLLGSCEQHSIKYDSSMTVQDMKYDKDQNVYVYTLATKQQHIGNDNICNEKVGEIKISTIEPRFRIGSTIYFADVDVDEFRRLGLRLPSQQEVEKARLEKHEVIQNSEGDIKNININIK